MDPHVIAELDKYYQDFEASLELGDDISEKWRIYCNKGELLRCITWLESIYPNYEKTTSEVKTFTRIRLRNPENKDDIIILYDHDDYDYIYVNFTSMEFYFTMNNEEIELDAFKMRSSL